jgi:CheY-like chemotaxis protein
MAKILVVDDDADVRRAMARILSAAGHQVSEAGDGRGALALYRADPADLIITDMYMPHADGIEVVARLRDEFPNARIIVTSGGGPLDRADVLDMAQRLGAQRTLPKPVERADLLAAVDGVLRG